MLLFEIKLELKEAKNLSLENVVAHFKQWNRDKDIMEFENLSATVEQAAETIGVTPARIAKTLSFRGEEEMAILVVAAGDAKIDNKKFRHTFGYKARMLSPDEVLEQTGHAVGGVCPFGLKNKLDVFLDVSLKRFTSVFPACGSVNSAIELTIDDLVQYSFAKDWVDVCKGWEEEGKEMVASSTAVEAEGEAHIPFCPNHGAKNVTDLSSFRAAWEAKPGECSIKLGKLARKTSFQ